MTDVKTVVLILLNAMKKKADTFAINLDPYGTLTPGDALTAAYLKNNLNICILENGSKNHLQQEEYLPH